MSTATAAIICSIVGGLFELAGLATVARGIWADQRQAARMFEPQPPSPRQTAPRMPRTTAIQLRHWDRRRSVGTPSTKVLADRQYESEAEFANTLARLTEEISNGFAGVVATLREEMAESDSDLREKIRYMLSESVSGRRLGVILLAVGIVFAMVGTLLAATS